MALRSVSTAPTGRRLRRAAAAAGALSWRGRPPAMSRHKALHGRSRPGSTISANRSPSKPRSTRQSGCLPLTQPGERGRSPGRSPRPTRFTLNPWASRTREPSAPSVRHLSGHDDGPPSCASPAPLSLSGAEPTLSHGGRHRHSGNPVSAMAQTPDGRAPLGDATPQLAAATRSASRASAWPARRPSRPGSGCHRSRRRDPGRRRAAR